MEYILDHLAFVCLTGAVIGGVLALIVGIGEYVDNKLKGKFSDYVAKFFGR